MKHKLFFCTMMLLATCQAASLDKQVMHRILEDSSSLFWECKTIAVEQKLSSQPYWKFPLWNTLKNISPHAFSEMARKQVKPEHIILARNSLIISDEFIASHLQALIPILPQELQHETDKTDLIAALHHALQSYGYLFDNQVQLVGYSHPLMGFLGYVSLTDDPVFAPCKSTGLTRPGTLQWQKIWHGQVVDHSMDWVYLGFLPHKEPPRLVRVLAAGWEVQDIMDGRKYHLLNGKGMRINIKDVRVEVQVNQKFPLFLDLQLKIP